jgi:WD40 repeat protein/serine/threonine protein kinase/Flp pilus assembly protein TadD
MSVDFGKMQEVFLAAVEQHAPGQWDAYLDEACAGDQELRGQVAMLLQAHAQQGSLPGRAALGLDRTGAYQPLCECPGTVIGPYKLLEQIGEGGFGVVFMAEQQQPLRRKVALKVLKPGMDSRQVIARFEAERQALALMEHPHIAQVFDGGTTAAGRPYFVMELVRGVPLTEFCDRNHLAVRQRLELFVAVCQAVQHAHQKGIIHRDLKPSNVLVTLHDDRPVAKVIDFGIAKATGQQLTDKTLFTNFAQMVGTPLYMSPEQAQLSGLDIDTRTDMYSLGVLLYELLTGTTPFTKERLQQVGHDEMRRIIREEEPPRPSARLSTLGQAAATVSTLRQSDPKRLRQLFRGELDWIVMKCLEKDRNRRYDTANGLASDVERYLRDEPVQACPPSALYRFRKFARRYKSILITALVVAAALVLMVVALAACVVLLWRDNRRAEEALQQTQQAQQVEEEARKQVERSLYFQRIGRADLEWWNTNVGRADQILDECAPEYRHWEWRYLKRLCHADLVTLVGHTQPVNAAAFSPDGRRLASASLDMSVKVWDLATGKEIRTLVGHSRTATCVAWSTDGRFLASGSGIWDEARPGEVKVWDAQTGRELLNLTGQRAAVAGVAFSPDSQRLAAANWDSTVRLWDLTTGREVSVLPGHQVRCIAFSPDGQRLAAGCHDCKVILWDPASDKEPYVLDGHSSDVNKVAFSPDGQRLVSGSWDQTARVWDVASGKELITPARHADIVWGVDFSPDGQSIASAGHDGSVRIWNAATGKEFATLRGHSGHVSAVAFSPGGRCLASASWDSTIKVWDLLGNQQGRLLLAAARYFRPGLSPDGQRIAMGLLTPANPHRRVPLKVHEVTTGRECLNLGECGGGCHGAVFSPDGERLAADWNKAIRIWDAHTGRELFTLAGHTRPVTRVVFSPDSQRLASASEDQTVKLWDVKAGREVLALVGHTDGVTDLAFSPDGRHLASASKDHTIRIWDANTGREFFTLKGHGAAVTEVAFSPRGERLASASADRTVRVWDSQTWHSTLTLPGHTGTVTAVAFSPDAQRLASASLDGSVRLWDTATGQEALTLRREFNQVFGVAFTPDGERLVASGSSRGGWEGFKVWAAEASLDPQTARERALRADAQEVRYRRATAHSRRSRWDLAVAGYSAAIELGMNTADVWQERGAAFGHLGQYDRAAADLARALEAKPGDSVLWYGRAAAKLGAGDVNGYRGVCASMRERFGKTTDPTTAHDLLYAFLLIPQDQTQSAEMLQWGQRAARQPIYTHSLAQAFYRAGRYVEAIKRFEDAVKIAPLRADDLCFLAMAQHQLGKVEEARATFARAAEWIEVSNRTVAAGDWWHWADQYRAKRLRKEAETLFEGK